jgi:hypothetical protein
MKQLVKVITPLMMMSNLLHAGNGCAVATNFIPRSQSRDKTLEMIGSVGHTHLFEQESYYGMFAATVEYNHSFDPKSLAHTLFGNDLQGSCCDTILIQGSQVVNRDPKAWLADNFYLPALYEGAFAVRPSIQNYLLNCDFYMGLDPLLCGMYIRLYGPLAHTRWNVNFCEMISSTSGAYPEGYFTVNALPADQLLQSFNAYVSGNALGNGEITQQATKNGVLQDFTTTFNKLRFSKISSCARTETTFSELRAELGWDFWNTQCYHVGANIQGAIPLGNKKKSEYFFDALVGNGHHWELGAGLTAHYMLYDNQEQTQLGFYLDANVTHLFNTKEQRTFDLCGKPNSRYMLAMRLGIPVEDDLQGDGGAISTTAIAQCKSEYTPVANLTTFDVNVSVNLQADVVAMFNYTHCNWSLDLGYNFWMRGCDAIEVPELCKGTCRNKDNSLCDPDNLRAWALKGDARVYGFESTVNGDPVALSPSEQYATINEGTNRNAPASNDYPYNQNLGVDNAQRARGNNTDLFTSRTDLNSFVFTSIQPIFLSCQDINFDQRNSGLTHKIFTHVNYTWDRNCLRPFFGVGGYAEFAHKQECNDNCPRSCDGCINNGVSNWGIWMRGGVSFN